jgi:alkylation response protein AidB-like acyl-CoA dehydrogenase
MIPEEYGGLGESLLTYALCVEEIAHAAWMSVSHGIITHTSSWRKLLRSTAPTEQKQRYLPRMATASSACGAAFSMSDARLRSDVGRESRPGRPERRRYTYRRQ